VGVTELDIRSRGLYSDGRIFGDVGAYERVDGTIRFASDPDHSRNRCIVDLARAPRDARGCVTWDADFCLLQPLEPRRGNGNLLVEVANRGRKLAPRMLNHAAPEAIPGPNIPEGDGFLMRHGWTVAWCGWQWDVIPSPGLMGLNAPVALEDGRPIKGDVLVEFQPNERITHKLLANRVHQPYCADDVFDPSAVMTVRDWPGGNRATVPRAQWRFAREERGEVVTDSSHVWLEGGFEPGKIYEVIFRTGYSPVVGSGLLAIRDSAAFLHHTQSDANPCGGRIHRVFGFGMSQSGRFLRHFLHLGLNLDEDGRQVFDGLLVHVAGARRGEFNQRFGQPSVQNTPNFGHLFPFADDESTDPLTGRTDGLLSAQRSLGGVPKILYTNTTAEYWRGDCSLGHVSLDGRHDLTLPSEVRNYHFSSTQHGLGVVPLVDRDPNEGSRGAHGFNAVDYAPLLRAALENLRLWVELAVPAPPSKHPRLSDGTLVSHSEAIAPMRDFPDLELPDPALVPFIQRIDLGPDQDRGIGRYPVTTGERYRTFVPRADTDGLELGGIRMPDLDVPIATYTGWNPRHHDTGGIGQIISMNGSSCPFPRTADEALAMRDPRASVAERYAGREEYLARVREAATALVRDRYMLEEDIELAEELAAERWDYFIGT
jgi:Alpha/beta hydrolase domain